MIWTQHDVLWSLSLLVSSSNKKKVRAIAYILFTIVKSIEANKIFPSLAFRHLLKATPKKTIFLLTQFFFSFLFRIFSQRLCRSINKYDITNSETHQHNLFSRFQSWCQTTIPNRKPHNQAVLEIIYVEESSNLIGWEHLEQKLKN